MKATSEACVVLNANLLRRGLTLGMMGLCTFWIQTVGYGQKPIAGPPPKIKTIQTLSPLKHGWYLAIGFDDAGSKLVMQKYANEANSMAFWEIDRSYDVFKSAGYLTSFIRNRGHSAYNGQALQVTGNNETILSGKSPKHGYGDRWLVRYIGYYGGRHAFYIQSHDLQFLTLHQQTGEVLLQPKLTPGAYWYINQGPTLPTDQLR